MPVLWEFRHMKINLIFCKICGYFYYILSIIQACHQHLRVGKIMLSHRCCCKLDETQRIPFEVIPLMGDKTIPDWAEPRLESFYPQFVAGIDLPYQVVVDSYRLVHLVVRDNRRVSEIDWPQPRHETTFWWPHKQPVAVQFIHLIKWPVHPKNL